MTLVPLSSAAFDSSNHRSTWSTDTPPRLLPTSILLDVGEESIAIASGALVTLSGLLRVVFGDNNDDDDDGADAG
jgi:hypothetical protein